MRIVAFILSLYVLVLTAIPCVDKPEDTALQKCVLSSKTADHQQEIDHCSPFCTCNCCASPKIQQEADVVFTSLEVQYDYFTAATPRLTSSHFTAVWQPPQAV